MALIHTVLAYTACYDLELHQVDAKSAYLNGEFKENKIIYMCLPPGINLTNDSKLSCRLLCPLYGLRQSGWHWYHKFLKILQETLGMQQCNVDQAVFYCIQGDLLIVVHIDDLMIATTSMKLMTIVKAALTKHVHITDSSELHWVLGIKVECNRDNCIRSLSQKQYLETIIACYGSADMKPSATPMEPGVYLTSVQSPKTAEEFTIMHDKPYCEAIGSLQCASSRT